MKRRDQKLLSGILAAALALSLASPGALAAEAESEGSAEAARVGSIGATVRLDYAQNLEGLLARGVAVELSRDGRALGSVPLGTADTHELGGYTAATDVRNVDGGELGGSEWPGYLDLTVSGLTEGTYTLTFRGEGYRTYTQEVDLSGYSRQVILGTGDATFTLGDVNGDGAVDQADWEAVAQAVGTQADSVYDLNGDGQVDVTDLAYVGRNLHAAGEAEVLNTALMSPAVDTEQLAQAVEVTGGRLEDLFQDNGQAVTLAAENGKVTIPVVFTDAPELERVELVSPDAGGSVQKGVATVETEDGQTLEVPFDNTLPEDVHALGREAGRNVVVIDLGKRVAVKKVTITVTKTEGGDYAVVETIRFLQDIVPENPVAANSKVRSITATEGSEQVTLKWGELPNVTGYRVYYARKGAEERRQMTVDVPRATVTGLENGLTYTFTVVPVNGDWQGVESEPVEATPQPAKAPDAPDMLKVNVLDGALGFSWQKTKNATYYEVYLSTVESGPFDRVGGKLTGTSLNIGELTNGQAYYLYVRAGNEIGLGRQSLVVTGTPKAVEYKEPAGIPTEGRISLENVASVALTDSGNWSTKLPAGTRNAKNMMDGDYETSWTSQSYGDGNFSRSKQVVVTFKDPVDLSNAIWVPRLDGGFANNLKAYTITVWKAGETAGTVVAPDVGGNQTPAVTRWWGVKNDPGSTKFAVLPFAPVTDVKKIAITLDQVGYSAISLSELIFLEYDPARALDANIDALFADVLHTRLADGVTQTQIDALRTRLNSSEKNYYLNVNTMADELDLATELLTGPGTGVVLEGLDYRSSAADNRKYGQGGSDLQPLGAAAVAGKEFTIYADIPAGETVTVYATQTYAEAATWQAKIGVLEPGRNVLTVPQIGNINTPRGGSLYVTYSGSRGDEIRLHVRRTTDIPVLELSNWYELDQAGREAVIQTYVDELKNYYGKLPTNNTKQTAALNVTEISMPSVLLSIPATAVWDNVRNDAVGSLYKNVQAWEDLMHVSNYTQGIDSTYENSGMTSRQNIRYMRMFAGAFMYAAGNHVGVGYGSCGGLVNGKPVTAETPSGKSNGLFGWGIAHEVGHNMDKLGKAEITNNIYSLMAQTYDGAANTLPSRLETSNVYASIFQKTALAHPGASGSVFTQLGMYWQLHLAYDDADQPMDFYNQFFKAWKAGTYFGGASAYDDKVALTAAGVAGRDLTEFFTRWGMQLSADTKSVLRGYDAEDRAIWYLSDQSRRDRLESVANAQGTVALEAQRRGDKEVLLTIDANISGPVQGYEILRNGRSIGFTAGTTYTDSIGSANHMAFTYSVRAYDTLGGLIAEAEASELRIAYDMTVDPGEYVLVRDAGTGDVTITFHEVTAISGLKITGDAVPQEGDFTVTIATTAVEDAPDFAEDGDMGEDPASAEDEDIPLFEEEEDDAATVEDEDATAPEADEEVTAAMEDEDVPTAAGNGILAKAGSFADNQAVDDLDSYLTYFNKPGAASSDTRIWTYDALTVTISGIPEDVAEEDILLVSYAGDDVAFSEQGSVGVLSEDYVYGDGAEDVIEAGTLVVTGTYRGDPVFNTLRVNGRFLSTKMEADGETTVIETERYVDGYVLFFAEIPEDGAVSDISDGIFLFVPNVQREAELQGAGSHCSADSLLPASMKLEFYRTDVPDSTENMRLTAETLWLSTPGGDTLPTIVLEGDE